MGEKSKIEWTDHTFNPWWGCEKVSPACANCYAESFSKSVGHKVWGGLAPRRFFGDKHWQEPLKWNRAAEESGERKIVFCASMADVLEDRPDLEEPRARVFRLVEETPWLDWIFLTKRPENFKRMVPPHWMAGKWPRNAWPFTTTENQEMADKRIHHILILPAAVRGISAEPLLGPITFSRLHQYCPEHDFPGGFCTSYHDGIVFLDWVIVGGESGHGARPCHPDWARSIRDQCQAAGVAFFFKQWGEWEPVAPIYDEDDSYLDRIDQAKESRCEILDKTGTQWPEFQPPPGSWMMERVGKSNAGRLLDGRTWDEFPQQEKQK